MSRFYFTLALLIALFSSSVRAETIVWDSLEEVELALPTHAGTPVSQFNYPNAVANDYAGEVEQFYFSDSNNGKFGDGQLVNQTYSANFMSTTQPSDSVSGSGRQYLGSESSPVAAPGIYSYCFIIPPQGTLTFTIVYSQTSSNAAVQPVTEIILVSIMNGETSVVGDPQFIGLRGQSYQVHGIDGAVYNIISDSNLQVNSRFVFLNEGQCPVILNKLDSNCWSHPGSYLGEMSFQTSVDGKLHAAFLQSGAAATGFAGVQVDGKALKVGDKVTFGAFSVELQDAYNVVINTDSFVFSLHNSDMFINQAIRSKVPLSELTSHGLLGQTHSLKKYDTALKFIAGKVDDYLIESDDIFGTDFMYNRFNL